MEDIIKIVKSLEDFGLLLKGVSEAIQNEAKEQNVGFLSITYQYISQYVLDKLGASLLGNILAGKGMNTVGERFTRAGYGSSIKNKDL